jgi:hypothetical protein
VSTPSLATEFLVLDRTPGSEGWIRLTAFSATEGRLECMQRLSSKPSAAVPPLDLFDHVRATLETRNQGRTWFLREAQPLRRRTGLGASYATLTHACRLARVIARTPIHDDSRSAVAALIDRALDAWETGIRPDAVYFKSLFLLARDEGFPVREEWLRQLAADERATTETILRQPAAEQTTAEPEVRRLSHALEDYLAHEHDFVFPAG